MNDKYIYSLKRFLALGFFLCMIFFSSSCNELENSKGLKEETLKERFMRNLNQSGAARILSEEEMFLARARVRTEEELKERWSKIVGIHGYFKNDKFMCSIIYDQYNITGKEGIKPIVTPTKTPFKNMGKDSAIGKMFILFHEAAKLGYDAYSFYYAIKRDESFKVTIMGKTHTFLNKENIDIISDECINRLFNFHAAYKTLESFCDVLTIDPDDENANKFKKGQGKLIIKDFAWETMEKLNHLKEDVDKSYEDFKGKRRILPEKQAVVNS